MDSIGCEATVTPLSNIGDPHFLRGQLEAAPAIFESIGTPREAEIARRNIERLTSP